MFRYLKILIPVLIIVVLGLAAVIYVQKYWYNSKPLAKETTGDQSLEDYYQTGQQLSSQQSAGQQVSTTTVTFLAVGDINLSRNVAAFIKQQNNIDYPFLDMADVLKSTNFNFANLESPVAPAGKEVVGGNSLIFGTSATNAKALKDYNFQILNLANNHAFDQDLAGIDVTRSTLDGLNILHEGTGDNLDQAWTPAVVTNNGIKICFVGASFSSVNDGGKTTNPYVARIEDLEHLKSTILNLKSKCDFSVVTMHAGTEYTRTPNQSQITFAHAAIDDGADMVIGAHPHWVQPIETYCPTLGATSTPSDLPYDPSRCKYIFYSLGNFIFDQNWSQDTSEGLALKIQISKSQISNPQTPGAATLSDLQGPHQPATLDSIQLIPLEIKNTVPEPATDQETKSILSKIGETKTILK